VLLGALLCVLFVLSNLTEEGKKIKASTPSFVRKLFYAAFLTGGYGAAVVWYLKNNISSLLINYWEAVLAYSVASVAVGLFATRWMRKNEEKKHFLTVVVKWIIRLTGVVLVYNSFASPLVSAVALVVLALFYVLYSINKWIVRKVFAKKVKSN
jgi:predicted neutral ceramidase superfamily lipid hydrolase